MYKKFVNLPNLTLLVALSLSTVAAWYSIIGLTAIFAGAMIPVIIMGGMLEIAKITTTVWLRKYWNRASWVLKLYLVPAVVALALLTSMGIFGFLSKAHIDQGVPTGDVAAKVALLDEKIKTERDNIDAARKALQQMDAQVDQRLSRSDSENAAERAVAIRRQQQGERTKLQKEIGDAQKVIAKLNEERAPIASELRKVEAEVGPIKYIAAMIYGDNPDQNILEKAVRWMIILLVLVFDPLAIALVLAANQSKEWEAETIEEDYYATPLYVADVGEKPTKEELADIEETEETEVTKDPHVVGWMFPERESTKVIEPVKEIIEDDYKTRWPFIAEETVEPTEEVEETADTPVEETAPMEIAEAPKEIQVEGVTKSYVNDGDYIQYDGRHMRSTIARGTYPELALAVDSGKSINTNFGTEFPKAAQRGDMFTRVDVLPNRVYKFDGSKWLDINKSTTSYLNDPKYIQHLVNKIGSGEYDPDLLTPEEQDAIESFIKKT